jgi:hypothetical protein
MKKEVPQSEVRKPSRLSPLKAMIYSSAGIGLVTLLAQLQDVPKYPRGYGE